MAENKIKEVAQLLGLELEEEFGIKGTSNRYKFTKNGLMWTQDDLIEWYPSVNINELILGKYEITKLSKPILTEKEKEYLSAVIKPFRDRVINITKESEYCIECIKITLNPLEVMTVGDIVYLPNFIKWSMYEGMEPDKAYTIDELGL